jgi:hypothetical protein
LGVFKHCEDGEIGNERSRQDRRYFRPAVGQRGQPVDQDGEGQQRDERRIAAGVERKRQQHQHTDPQSRIGIDKAVDQDRCRQKHQQEGIIVEKHRTTILQLSGVMPPASRDDYPSLRSSALCDA